jgi:hypothetical protein
VPTVRTLIQSPAAVVSVVAMLLTVAACGDDADSSSQSASSGGSGGESSGTATPGQAQCTFDGQLKGAASVKDLPDAYEVTFTGQPVHPKSRSIYAMSVSGEDSKAVSLQIRFDEGKLSGYGVVDDTAELTAVPGKPSVSADSVSGTFPKVAKGLSGMKVSKWAPDVTFLDGGSDHGQCNSGTMQELVPAA